jgi:hypothetical protein
MKLSDQVQLKGLIPSRIRTIMVANVPVALALVLFINFKTQVINVAYRFADASWLVLVYALFAILMTAPVALVEVYLYRKKKGVVYDLIIAPPRRRREPVPRLGGRRYPRTSQSESTTPSRPRTRLFESSSATESVSRPALLLSVGDKLARSGKNEAARRCYQQIIERFAGAREAQDASMRLKSLASGRTTTGR